MKKHYRPLTSRAKSQVKHQKRFNETTGRERNVSLVMIPSGDPLDEMSGHGQQFHTALRETHIGAVLKVFRPNILRKPIKKSWSDRYSLQLQKKNVSCWTYSNSDLIQVAIEGEEAK